MNCPHVPPGHIACIACINAAAARDSAARGVRNRLAVVPRLRIVEIACVTCEGLIAQARPAEGITEITIEPSELYALKQAHPGHRLAFVLILGDETL